MSMPFLAFFTFSLQDRRNFVDVFYAQSLGGYFSEIQVLLKFEMTWNAVSHLRPSQPMMGKELLNWWCRDSGTSKLLYAVLIASCECDHLVILRSVMYQHFNHEFASIFIDTKLTSSLEEEPANVCSRRSRGGWLKSKDALFVCSFCPVSVAPGVTKQGGAHSWWSLFSAQLLCKKNWGVEFILDIFLSSFLR